MNALELVKEISQRKVSNSTISISEAKEKFEDWQNHNKKRDKSSYFDDELFGALYVTRFYESRISSIFQILMEIFPIDFCDNMDEIKVTVFGCGPGPEIVAFLSYIPFIRESFNGIIITALDKLNYWSEYIWELNRYYVNNAIINFENRKYDNNYLESCLNGDICIMSFNDAVNSDINWGLLKEKFSAIIIIDITNKKLINSLIEIDFQVRVKRRISYYYFFKT